MLTDEKNPYIENFEIIARNLERPLITFEEAHRVNLTAQRYKQLGRADRTYLIKTRANTAIPKGITVPCIWTPLDNVLNFLIAFKPPIDLVGGSYDEENPYDWCLGAVAHMLNQIDMPFQIIKEATFL